MTRSVWVDRWWRWAVPLAALLINVAILSTYRMIYAGRVVLLEGQIEGERDELSELSGQRERLAALVERAHRSHDGIGELYRESFATEGERLAGLIREIKDLATRSGLVPEAISYPAQEIDDHDLIKRSIVFSVEGTYSNLRTFINLLELSESFVALERIRLSAADPKLRIGLELSTLFAGRDRPVGITDQRVDREGVDSDNRSSSEQPTSEAPQEAQQPTPEAEA